jgi:hypothetical protein
MKGPNILKEMLRSLRPIFVKYLRVLHHLQYVICDMQINHARNCGVVIHERFVIAE